MKELDASFRVMDPLLQASSDEDDGVTRRQRTKKAKVKKESKAVSNIRPNLSAAADVTTRIALVETKVLSSGTEHGDTTTVSVPTIRLFDSRSA